MSEQNNLDGKPDVVELDIKAIEKWIDDGDPRSVVELELFEVNYLLLGVLNLHSALGWLGFLLKERQEDEAYKSFEKLLNISLNQVARAVNNLARRKTAFKD